MGRDKAALVIDGQSLLDRAIQRLGTIADPVIIAVGSHSLVRTGCLSVADPFPERGPLAGLVAAIGASPHPRCAVVAVDMPDCDPLLRVCSPSCGTARTRSCRSANAGRNPCISCVHGVLCPR
jgi:molybdopterin-guanine dinucleotide biosynthesis protein A